MTPLLHDASDVITALPAAQSRMPRVRQKAGRGCLPVPQGAASVVIQQGNWATGNGNPGDQEGGDKHGKVGQQEILHGGNRERGRTGTEDKGGHVGNRGSRHDEICLRGIGNWQPADRESRTAQGCEVGRMNKEEG
eukprot:gene11672-biopygen9663